MSGGRAAFPLIPGRAAGFAHDFVEDNWNGVLIPPLTVLRRWNAWLLKMTFS